ncbi:hypothetical protein BT93_H3773 [Corymbia citriodora subsp. variegata]|nr:hypothetical protein BT93_H3773 [Corymbia citriodora subsp. variegata]
MDKPMEPYYEVFLSFRGLDTRHDITDILYHSLVDAGIRAYRDDEELCVGEEIGPELLQAIKQSKISIPIFSKEYAASKWCLMELVQMVECKEKWGQQIMPIFYDIEPSEVRNQTAIYGKAIQSHINKQLYTGKTIQNWKTALNKVGALKGWELKARGKGEFTREVVQKVLIKLKKNYLAVPDFLVEMDDHVDRIMELIGGQPTETKIVGIHGMGGVGKTTLAKIIYNKLLSDSTKRYNLSNSLDEMDDQVNKTMEVIGEQTTDSTKCCFLSNIGNTKIERKKQLTIDDIDEGKKVIKELLSSKEVILLLDDVDQKTKLDALVGIDRCWFGRGSKVIITTRNKEVLKDVKLKHELTGMDFDHSLKLFSKHAFRRDHPPMEYVLLSEKAVEICGHLPLTLEIIGSFLAGKGKNFWETTLEKLGTIPHENVEEKLNISIKALQPRAREIFLDVCCFFIGYDVRIVRHMWEICGFFPDYYLDVLQQMSLIKIIERNRLWMHDLLRDLGRDFVCQNGNYKPEKQSRVWDHQQANDVLIAKGTENVEAIRLKFDHQFQYFIEMEESEILPNLRFLQVDCVDLDENNVQHFPSINCEITDDWEGWNHLKMAKNLKVLNLTKCRNLRKIPDFSTHENLEQLILHGCEELVQVDRSIGKLKHLMFLNLGGCRKLQMLPDEMVELEALRELLVDGTSITKIPEWKGMKKLETLSASSCESLSMCNFSSCLTSLLNPRLGGTKITELPFGNFASLVELNLSWSKIQELPNSIEKMKNLRVLRVSYTGLQKLPSALGMLENLEEIYAHGCRNLRGEIPSEIGRLSCLRILILLDTRISEVPKLPESMTNLYLTAYPSKRQPDFSNLLNLRVLELDLMSNFLSLGAPSLNWIEGLRKLESLQLCCRSLFTLPSDLNLLLKLKKLELVVNNLECLPMLPQNFSYLSIHGHRLKEKSIDLSYLEKLSELEVCDCEQLIEIQGLEHLKSLKQLSLYQLSSLVKLSDLTNLKKLRGLRISFCPKLVEVQGQLELLEELRLISCKSLEKLPDLLSFKNVIYVTIEGCHKLKEIQGLEDSENLSKLSVGDLPSLEKLPDLTNSKELKELNLKLCPRLIDIRGRLESLVQLHIDGCRSLEKLSDPLSFKNIRYFTIEGCQTLKEIQGLEDSENLKKLPDLTNSKELKELSVKLCPRLVEIRGGLELLKELHIDRCRSLRKLSGLLGLKKQIIINECKWYDETLIFNEYKKKHYKLQSLCPMTPNPEAGKEMEVAVKRKLLFPPRHGKLKRLKMQVAGKPQVLLPPRCRQMKCLMFANLVRNFKALVIQTIGSPLGSNAT